MYFTVPTFYLKTVDWQPLRSLHLCHPDMSRCISAWRSFAQDLHISMSCTMPTLVPKQSSGSLSDHSMSAVLICLDVSHLHKTCMYVLYYTNIFTKQVSGRLSDHKIPAIVMCLDESLLEDHLHKTYVCMSCTRCQHMSQNSRLAASQITTSLPSWYV